MSMLIFIDRYAGIWSAGDMFAACHRPVYGHYFHKSMDKIVCELMEIFVLAFHRTR